MEFTVKIKCDNDAFTEDPEMEVSDILRRIITELERHDFQGLSLFDCNGNHVGNADFME